MNNFMNNHTRKKAGRQMQERAGRQMQELRGAVPVMFAGALSGTAAGMALPGTLCSENPPAGRLHLKDPGSAITHFIAALLVLPASALLLFKAARQANALPVIALAVFSLSMLLLYCASTLYHSLNINETVNRRLRKLDHMMISVMIAGSYTPICLITLRGKTGTFLCALVWSAALAGILIKAFWITCPKWFSSLLYISMGWLCVLALPQIIRTLSGPAFAWLLAGGVIYTIGGIIYALKLPLFNSRHRNFGSHEIFHLFVMGGSACHFVTMFLIA